MEMGASLAAITHDMGASTQTHCLARSAPLRLPSSAHNPFFSETPSSGALIGAGQGASQEAIYPKRVVPARKSPPKGAKY